MLCTTLLSMMIFCKIQSTPCGRIFFFFFSFFLGFSAVHSPRAFRASLLLSTRFFFRPVIAAGTTLSAARKSHETDH